MLIAIFYIANCRQLFLNIVSLRELNGLKPAKKRYIVAIYQTNTDFISIQA